MFRLSKSNRTINWNLAGRARSQCVTVLSVVRSAPAAARNGTGQFSVLNDKFQFYVPHTQADNHIIVQSGGFPREQVKSSGLFAPFPVDVLLALLYNIFIARMNKG